MNSFWTKQNKFFLAVGFQLMVIIIMIIFKSSILVGGTEIKLKIMPVDPRDLLRGDYVTFDYDISNLDAYYFYDLEVSEGDNIYVSLEEKFDSNIRSSKYNYYDVVRVSKNKPKGDSIILKGKIASYGGGDIVRVKYGIEEYFVPEGKGQINFAGRNVMVGVVVNKDGNAVLKNVYMDGEKW